MPNTIEQSIEVDVPVDTAYDQWTQFEDFPHFMDGVRSVTQTDDTHLLWLTEIAGEEREWQAEITEQEPEKRIAWRAVGEVGNAGVVTFHKLSDARSKVMLQMDIDPQNLKDKVADAVGITDAKVKGDLERFKTFIETRGAPTGQWRGEVDRDTNQVKPDRSN
ncbi:MAG: SRPBCC family protein [Actinobacteria bacterium]|nr:SRPBCC family protein [Actinomycetota bacterium]